MSKRRLGQTDMEVEPLVFGGNVLGWTLDEPSAFRVLDAYVDAPGSRRSTPRTATARANPRRSSATG